MTYEILYGDDKTGGIIDFLTINSKAAEININAAPKEVLMAIPGMTPEIADEIIAYREIKEIDNIQEIQGILGEGFTIMMPYIDTEGSDTFTIDAIGYKGNKKEGYAIRATVTISGLDEYKYLYYKSPAYINP